MIEQLLKMIRSRLVGFPAVAALVGANVVPWRRAQVSGVGGQEICYRIAGGESVTTFDVVAPNMVRMELELAAWSASYQVALTICDAMEAALAGWVETGGDAVEVLGCFRNSIIDLIAEEVGLDEVTQWSVTVNYTVYARAANAQA